MEPERRFRSQKKPIDKKKSDRLLNYLISIVVVLILVVAGFIFLGDSNEKKVAEKKPQETVKEQPKEKATTENKKEQDKKTETTKETEQPTTDKKATKTELGQSDTAVVTKSTDGIVKETIEDTAWKPFATAQQDTTASPHQSSYNTDSVDWQEKLGAIAEVTGLSKENMTVWFIKNNGTYDSAIGTVSSKDKTKKYRVSLIWVKQQGWKAEKVEILKQIEGAY